VLIAVMLFAMLGLAALAIDLAALRDGKAEAQRVADATALAGAIAFRDKPSTDPTSITDAQTNALNIARQNKIRADTVDVRNATVTSRDYGASVKYKVYTVVTNEVTLNIIPDSQRVRAFVHRDGLATFFGGLLAKPFSSVTAVAAAQASQSGISKCVKPLAIPDLWSESNTSSGKNGQDKNANKVWDTGEGWQFEPPSDKYVAFDPNAPASQLPLQTGYGSAFRNGTGQPTNDYGRSITIKAQKPTDAITSGWFYPWRIGDSKGANDYKNNITGCNPSPVELGVTYKVENGDMVGPTKQAFNDLIATDAGAHWDPTADGGKGGIAGVDSRYGDWRNSPRVVPLALFNPNIIANIKSGGSLDIQFNNIALFFVEGFEGNGNQAPLKGRFLYFASGTGTGPVLGPLVKTLQLIQ